MDVTLQDLVQGALNEEFEANFQKIIDNINDPNTKASAKRELNIKMIFKPDEDREMVELQIET